MPISSHHMESVWTVWTDFHNSLASLTLASYFRLDRRLDRAPSVWTARDHTNMTT